MSDIKAVYRKAPAWPADEQCPGAQRYNFAHPTLGALLVDALGGAPTQAEIDLVLAGGTQDDRAAADVDTKDRLLFEINFDQENRIRAIEGKSAITRIQYRDALIARWKTLNP